MTPGFIDMHSRLPPENFLRLNAYMSLLYLYHGVTTIRETGDADGSAIAAIESATKRNIFPAPRIFPCAHIIGDSSKPPSRNLFRLNDSDAETADRVVAFVKLRGFNCIIPSIGLEGSKLESLISAAHRNQIQVVGQVASSLGQEEASIPEILGLSGISSRQNSGQNNGLNLVEDWESVDDARLSAVLEISKKFSISHTPILNSHRPLPFSNIHISINSTQPLRKLLPRFYMDFIWNPSSRSLQLRCLSDEENRNLKMLLEKKVRFVKSLIDSGVSVFAGTDLRQPYVIPGLSLHQEAAIFQQLVGLSRDETLALISTSAASHLTKFLPNKEKMSKLGKIEEGAPADLLLFQQRPHFSVPLTDLDLSFNSSESIPDVVIKDGCLFIRSILENRIVAWRRHFDGWFWDAVSSVTVRLFMQNLF